MSAFVLGVILGGSVVVIGFVLGCLVAGRERGERTESLSERNHRIDAEWERDKLSQRPASAPDYDANLKAKWLG